MLDNVIIRFKLFLLSNVTPYIPKRNKNFLFVFGSESFRLREEIRKVLSKGKAAGVLRLVFHDAGTFEIDEKIGITSKHLFLSSPYPDPPPHPHTLTPKTKKKKRKRKGHRRTTVPNIAFFNCALCNLLPFFRIYRAGLKEL